MNQRKSCHIAESTAQIQIPEEHQWNPNFAFELRGGKATHVDGVQVFHRIVVTLLGASRVGDARRSLATLAFDPRVRPRNAYPRCKGEPSLCLASTQECILTISTHDASVKSYYAPLQLKGEASQCSSSMQG